MAAPTELNKEFQLKRPKRTIITRDEALKRMREIEARKENLIAILLSSVRQADQSPVTIVSN
jgi:hypothetical protein